MRYAILLILSGCASQMTGEEREYQHRITFEKWQLCRQVYEMSGVPWVSHFHIDDAAIARGHIPRYLDMRYDIGFNTSCRRILRQAGFD